MEPLPTCYRFDRFEIRPAERMLYVDGHPASLGTRAIDLLLALVARHGRLVSKAELLDLVWPNLVVEENNLQVQISTLRKLLGPKAIATVPGRGYRFAAALDGAGAPAHSAAVATQASALTALPTLASRLWGRERDLALLHAQRHHALITIVGAGGIGKTAFALNAAHAWRVGHKDGAVWVDLSGISDALLVLTVVAQALGLPSGGREPLPAFLAALRPLQLLLVLDNAEHVLEAVASLAHAITVAAPDVRLLVTSQGPLKVDGERVFRLSALSVPDPGTGAEEALTHGAVALFADRAHAADHRFALTDANVEAVMALCRRLDGLALAIKLAAARVPLMGLQGITDRLDERFKLLGEHHGVTPVRHQTLRGALDWSHDLLSPAEQAVFRRLSVFAGGFTLELASAVAHDDDLDEWGVIDALGMLVDRSLVAADGGADGDVPRYRLLDSPRDYAALKLDAAGQSASLKRRHALAMAALMEQAYEQYWATPDAVWLESYGPEIDNVRAAMDWATAHEPGLAIKMIGAASSLFMLLGLAAESRQRCAALEAQVGAKSDALAVPSYWLERSRLHWGISNALMHDFADRAAQQFRAARDDRGLYQALRCVAGSAMLPAAQALAILAEMRTVERPEWPPRLRLQRLFAQVTVLKSIGQFAQARTVCEDLLARAQAAGLDAVVSAALSDLAALNLSLGEIAEAVRHCRQLLSRARHRRDNFVLHALAILACASFLQDDTVQARAALVDFAAASRSRDWEWFGLYAGLFALLATREGRAEVAARLLGKADAEHQHLGPRVEQMAHIWSQARVVIECALDAPTIARLRAEGALMDPQALSALALEPAVAHG
ncbi:MAG: helix-turn-helix transcriptional regulator [Burkholderiales bacterium]|nr:helix-turn-helix transcriptional regulator [Burkholderiales bacterium]